MKSYTDLEQSKKLSEFLPIERADMYYSKDATYPKILTKYEITHANVLYGSCDIRYFNIFENTPAWSLAALLEQIPSDLGSMKLTVEKCDSEPFKYGLNYHDRWGREDDIQTKYYDDLVDACYEMIIKLHKQKII